LRLTADGVPAGRGEAVIAPALVVERGVRDMLILDTPP